MTQRNYNIHELDIELASPGFILGSSRLGSPLGALSPDRIDVADQLTRIEITTTRSVQDNLWLQQQPDRCTVQCRFEDTPQLFQDYTLIVSYRGQQLYAGRVLKATRSVTRDSAAPDGRRWDVSMVSTDTAERAAGQSYRPAEFGEASIVDAILERVTYAREVVVSDSVLDRVSTFRIGAGVEETQLVSELFQQIERIASCLVVTDPLTPGTIYLMGYDDGALWTLDDQARPSYRGTQFTEDPSTATGVTVTVANSADDPANKGTLRTGGVERRDVEVSLPLTDTEQVAQAVANSYPILNTNAEYVSSVDLPFQEELDLSALPTSLTHWLNAEKRTAAITSVRHLITPAGWQISIGTAPYFLITREGVNPTPVTALAATTTDITWTDPVRAPDLIAVGWRTDGRYAQHPNDCEDINMVEPGVETFDISGEPSGTYLISAWVLAPDATYFSEPRITEVVKP